MISVCKVAVLIASTAVAAGRYYTEVKEHQLYAWEAFKSEWHKVYDCAEVERLRFNVFIENLKRIDEHNLREAELGGSAIHGITRFADMTEGEFADTMLGANPDKFRSREPRNATAVEGGPINDHPLVDWTGTYTTPVKNQGSCGSCWAFSATEQIESDAMRTLGDNYILSPEQIVQCDPAAMGCHGGYTETAYKYVTVAGGLEPNADYPYTSGIGITGSCKVQGEKEVVTVKSFSTITDAEGKSTEDAMAKYVQSTGPLSVCLAASTWQFYSSGIVHMCGQKVDHCVQAVGVDTTDNGYWKVRNSWGTHWGESGFIRLAYGKDMCQITYDPTYVTVADL